MTTDFLGNVIKVGDFVAYPGGGNRTAEYGLILMKVIKIDEKGISCERFDVDYENKKINIVTRKITNTNKLVVVKPSKVIQNLFIDNDLNKTVKYNFITKWLHGQIPIKWVD